MKYLILSAALSCFASPAFAGTVTANNTLQRGSIISENDVTVIPSKGETRSDILDVYIGKELKRTVYAGYKINPGFVGEPILVKRNTRVNMVYRFGSMEISAWGRALDQGAVNDVISIMNLESRKRVQGRVLASGDIEVKS